jgi:hypothetical protein
MKTTDLFKNNRSAKKINESIEKTFGKKLNLENFDMIQLQDACNKLRTQVHVARSQSGFNENLENDALTQAQWMLDAINAEIAERQEFIVDNSGETVEESQEENNDPSGEEMNTKISESKVDAASAVVTAKTMVDKVGRWIEELSGMENDTLLQLGDKIRDEIGQEQARGFLEQVAPAIQAALDSLKQSRETMSAGVRMLTGEEQSAETMGSAPEGEEMQPVGGDEMNMPAEEPEAPAGDEFAAADAAAGGAEAAGREQRESINRSNRLLKVLAG